ncbi:hypothetical protein GN330_00195 [Nitratireductor sp. CAU 1489]|uniref:Uncharacterized protein n=1 Tax=Nitratireductor arenosus TaxID=2682096 RepID=A0A844QCG2_9HYPH|nr:hypothetical protein [Nitratireductor arenosus]MVA95671.1 hypothetical protein [Nitratireductor arenosus]
MRTNFLVATTLGAMMAAGGTASAQDGERYWIEKSQDGYVRMDRQTGEMSYCSGQGGRLVCRLAADDRRALQDEIARLQDEIVAIEERLAALESRPRDEGLPSEDEFEKTMGYMERFFRRFMGIVKEFERDLGGEPDDSTSQKT